MLPLNSTLEDLNGGKPADFVELHVRLQIIVS